MKWRFIWAFFFLCSSCGEDGPPPRETSLLESWEVKEVLTSWSFFPGSEIQFINEWVGFRLDKSLQKLYKTTDAGRTYTPVFQLPNSSNPPALYALDEQHLWLTTVRNDEELQKSFAQIYRSIDGGNTWEISERESAFFEMISFVSPSRGFAYAIEYTGEYGDYFRLFQTEDGGATWGLADVDMSKVNLKRILWKTSELGFLGGWNGAEFRTLNGGRTWEPFRPNNSQTPSIFYPIDADQYYDMRFTETLKGDWSSEILTKLEQPIYILSQSGQDIIGVLMEENCLPNAPCKNYLMSSTDGGKIWKKHFGLPLEEIFYLDQEIQPGLVVIPDRYSAKVILIQKK